jgi:short-subunit dehydrogenase involved in D-alanine esterification of teichoic acids
MNDIKNDVFEIGYGTTQASIKASRADLDKSFQQMNSRW